MENGCSVCRRLCWVVNMDPEAQKRHRHTKCGRTYDPSSALKTAFRKKSLLLCPGIEHVDTHAMSMRVVFRCRRPQSHYTTKARTKLSKKAPLWHVYKCDIDNYVKFVMDALCGTFYKDDAQIFEINARKEWVHEGEQGVDVELVSYE